VFVHISAVERSGMKALAENQKLSYELQDGRDGRVMATELQSLQSD
jgi:CspA family cold shock protein